MCVCSLGVPRCCIFNHCIVTFLGACLTRANERKKREERRARGRAAAFKSLTGWLPPGVNEERKLHHVGKRRAVDNLPYGHE